MPIIYRCDKCGREEVKGGMATTGWYTKMLVGGTQVLCPECGKEQRAEEIEEDLIKKLSRGDEELEEQIKQALDKRRKSLRMWFFWKRIKKKGREIEIPALKIKIENKNG